MEAKDRNWEQKGLGSGESCTCGNRSQVHKKALEAYQVRQRINQYSRWGRRFSCRQGLTQVFSRSIQIFYFKHAGKYF